MTKVYPNAASSPPLSSDDLNISNASKNTADPDSVVLTVWKKSLLFNCDGFTVYDSHGNLVYRVDNYASADKAQIFLMDSSGNTLLTIRRKKLSLGDTWLVYDGETAENPLFVVRKNVNLLNAKCLAQVKSSYQKKYEIEGSYGQRCCGVYDEKRRRVAEIKQKEAAVKGVALGKDIFRLVVQPGFDATVAMALVILLDLMFAS